MRHFISFVVGLSISFFGSIQTCQADHLAPLRLHSRFIKNEYLVVFDPQSDFTTNVEAFGGTVKNRFDNHHTVWMVLNDKQLSQIRSDSRVLAVEANGIVTADGVPSWGLDRIDQQYLPLNSTFHAWGTGAGAHAYIIDTGILGSHQEFAGRMGNGYSFIYDNLPAESDCMGHGTHVAGTVAGSTVGVAPQATLHSVRVMDCTGKGSVGSIFAGMNWVINNHIKPAVANMSLTSDNSDVLNEGVQELVKAGVTVVVAAGNNSQTACSHSPASEPMAITVAASDNTDTRAGFSNFGSCVDIFAPGVNINSASYTGDSLYRTASGTSMASPHVAGAAALFLGRFPAATPAQTSNELYTLATNTTINNSGADTPNRMLYVGDISSFPPAVDPGWDRIVDLNTKVTLDGSKTFAPRGVIISYVWTQISGPANATLATPRAAKSLVTGLSVPGIYTFSLKATDSFGFSGTGQIKITANLRPIVKAGPAIKTNARMIDLLGTASDPDGALRGTKWTKIQGAAVNIWSPFTLGTRVSSLKPGVYVFQLKATDNLGFATTSNVRVTITK